jgi:hypothetical protein
LINYHDLTKLYYITLSGFNQSDIAGRLENNRNQGLTKWGCSHGKNQRVGLQAKFLSL